MTADTIARIQAWACSIPLEHPLSFGAYTISSREYVALRLTTAAGVTADAYGLSRRAPVDVALLELVAPAVIGRTAFEQAERLEDVARATRALDGDGTLARATSLLDIALWDIRAQVAQVPLWKLLGGTERDVPVQLVEGYALPDEDDEDFADRLAARVGEGFGAIKIEAASYPDTAAITRRLKLVRDRVGDDVELVVDMAWSWRDADEAIAAVNEWEDLRLCWVEDPLLRSCVEQMAQLRGSVTTPIGAGDEATSPEELERLLRHDAVDVVRADATTCGGITALAGIRAQTKNSSVSLSMHVQPEIHQHAVFAWPEIARLEAFPLDRPFDLTHRLIAEPVMAREANGRVAAPQELGTGIRLNDQVLESAAYRYGERR
jgi:L-alanine-DL-glutamate epimerase-like enolase superfamily enzyme